MRRPALPLELDDSRAAERAADPAGWAMGEDVRDALNAVIAARRDTRSFRPDPVPDELVRAVLAAGHRAPSVGLSQPWRFIVVRDAQTRAAVRGLAERERVRQAPRFGERARRFLDQKVEGVLEAPVGVCVCCVPPAPGQEVLGRGTIPETDLYSTACAVQNLWLAARAEGLGVGWVSLYRPADLRAVLGIPDHVEPVAWLCLGWPDERPPRPGLERSGWAARRPLDEVVFAERWAGAPAPARGPEPDAAARIEIRDRADELVKPPGSLGLLESVVERWAAATGAPPPERLRAAHVIFAADHGHTVRGTSPYGRRVSGQVASAAAAGRTAIGVLAASRGERLVVADVGLFAPAGPPVRDARVAAGSADLVEGPALTAAQVRAAMDAGERLVGEAAADVDCLVLGEIGIGNTTCAAALLCVLTGAAAAEVVGRGAGSDAQGVARKLGVVEAALARHADAGDPLQALRRLGGLELAALTGGILAAWRARRPVLLDGFAAAACALVAVRIAPPAREWLLAAHRSAEPGHRLALADLGLEPLLDLRLRLGEGSGAALALPLVEAAALLHRRMATFEDAGIDR